MKEAWELFLHGGICYVAITSGPYHCRSYSD